MLEVHPIPAHKQFQNLTGEKFGRLLVVSFGGKRLGRSTWNCLCDCGNTVTVFAQPLKEGRTSSCGCLLREVTANRNFKHGCSRRHNKTVEYVAWKAMKTRCGNENQNQAHNYVLRGIRVCQRWLDSFDAFLADMGLKPSPQHSLDRIDNDGNYEPGNCRWATPKEQANNNRRWASR